MIYWVKFILIIISSFTFFESLGISYRARCGDIFQQKPTPYFDIKNLEILAEQGNAVAQNHLGFRYANGIGVKVDHRESRRFHLKAARKKDSVAEFNLGVKYFNGEGVDRNYQKAFYWFSKAANQGHAQAQHNLGVMYFNGMGVEINHGLASWWYTESAKQGLNRRELNHKD